MSVRQHRLESCLTANTQREQLSSRVHLSTSLGLISVKILYKILPVHFGRMSGHFVPEYLIQHFCLCCLNLNVPDGHDRVKTDL